MELEIICNAPSCFAHYIVVTADDLYEQAAAAHGRGLERMVYAYEADPGKRADLLQEIHIALWNSFKTFEGRCSVKTWVYRIAHNAATS